MHISKRLSFADLYIFLWLIYMVQGFIFRRTGTIYSTIVLSALMGITAYYFLYAISHYKLPAYMKGLTVLVIMFSIYGLILILSGNTIRFMNSGVVVKNFNYIKHIYISLLPIYPFYVFTRKGMLFPKKIMNWTWFFFATALISFLMYRQKMLSLANNEVEDITNNYGYTFLSLIPLMAFGDQNRRLQYFGLGFAMVMIILGMKRGAILIGALCIIWFLFRTMKTAIRGQKFRVIFLSVVLVLASVLLTQNMLETSDYFNLRVEQTIEGNSSNRDRLYGLFWRHFINETNPFLFLFGNGANATLTFASNYAHNDWLEIAINQGLLGLVIYLYYWISFYKTWKRSKYDDEIYLAFGLSLLIYFLKSVFSMSYGDMTIYSTICVGYCMGMFSEYENRIKKSSSLLQV